MFLALLAVSSNALAQGDLLVNGNIGVNNSTPGNRIDINQASNTADQGIKFTNAAGDTTVEMFITANKAFSFLSSGNFLQYSFNGNFKVRPGDLFVFGADEYSFGSQSGKLHINRWETFADPIITIDSNENVGIGNTTPLSKLAVSGLPTSPPDASYSKNLVCITDDGNMWIDTDGDALICE